MDNTSTSEEKEMRFKALVFVRLRGSVSDAAGNAVMKNVHLIAPNLKPHLLRIGKCIDFWFDAETEEIARKETIIIKFLKITVYVISTFPSTEMLISYYCYFHYFFLRTGTSIVQEGDSNLTILNCCLFFS